MRDIINLIDIFYKLATKVDYIDFPKNEHKSLQKRLDKNLPIYTTRIDKEKNKYKEHMILNSPFGKLRVDSVEKVNDLNDHPFINELTKEQKEELKNQKMDLIKLTKYDIENWIKTNVKDPKNNCFFYAAVLSLLFPELKLIKGKHSKQYKEDSAHFYCRDEDDNIIDPTEKQYEAGDYWDIEEVSAKKNIDYILKHKKFKTLSDEDQQICRK